jgi:two-component system, NarL family, sensor kinase
LHDSTAQHLVAVGLNLMRLQKFLKVREGRTVLEEIENSLDEATKEVRVFTYLLHPPRLAADGLRATLGEFAGGFSRRTGLATIVRAAEEVDALPFDLQRTLLRITQEALTNAHRHAEASRLIVDLRIRSGRVRLRVADDGRGLAAGVRCDASKGALLGVGISGMRLRLLQFDGDLKLLSGRRGTLVLATAPASAAQKLTFDSQGDTGTRSDILFRHGQGFPGAGSGFSRDPNPLIAE